MYIREHKGKWRYAESFSDPLTGRKREVSVILDKNTASTRKEASALLQEKIRQKRAETTPGEMTVEELTKKFVAYQYQMWKESTALEDEIEMRGICKLLGSETMAHRVSAPIIRDRLDSAGKSNTWKNQRIKHIKTLWRWAYRQGFVADTSVPDRLEKYPEKTTRQKVADKFLESDDLRELIDSMDENTTYQLLTRFLVLSGVRVGEAFALTLKDVDMTAQSITVDKTYSLTTKKVQTTKTEMSERVLHMRPELLAVVRSQLLHQKQICLAFGVRSPLLFPWMDGGHMHYEAYAKYFREHVVKIRGSALPVHSLRHTYTSLMAEAGVPIETISRQLGHADSSITKQIYMHVTDKVREADNARLDAVQIL